MALFKEQASSWDTIGGLRDMAGSTVQRSFTPWSVGGRRGNPSQKEPFEYVPLPPLEGDPTSKDGVDFLLRDGALSRSATDVSRITKLLFTTTRGGLFTAKQNMLSHSGVATEASGLVNEGIYLPTSTLAQVGGVALGGHLNKQGVNPFRLTGPTDGITIDGVAIKPPLGLPLYSQVVRNDQETEKNRLVGYFNNKINKTTNSSQSTPSLLQSLTGNFIKLDGPNILDSYSGGPGSERGVGRTTIRMSPEQRTGKNNDKLSLSGFFLHDGDKETPTFLTPENTQPVFTAITPPEVKASGEDLPLGSYTNYSVFKRPSSIAIKGAQIFNENASLSRRYEKLTGETTFLNQVTTTNVVGPLQIFQNSVYRDDDGSITLDTNEDITNPIDSFSATLSQQTIREQPRNRFSSIGADFRTKLTKKPTETIAQSLDYETQKISERVNQGDPGVRGNRSNYQLGKRAPGAKNSTPLDKITAYPLYQSGLNAKNDSDLNDLVKFRIASIDSANPANSTYIHFRAFLGSFTDNYNSSWGSQKLMGRAENFYKYEGFDRSISMNWTVPAQSKNELMIMHQKLNFLASNLAPDYVGDRFMAGPLVRLTVGGYLYEQYGFIESLSLNIPDTSPWEIAVAGTPSGGTEFGGGGLTHDPTVKEVPHVLEVSGFSFRPIHDFVVQKQKNDYAGPGSSVSKYGIQKYISLKSAGGDGYNVKKTAPDNTGR